MAHINVGPLFETPYERVREHMLATIVAFMCILEPDETGAYIVNGGAAHRGIIDALSYFNIPTEIRDRQQFGIRIGSTSGSLHINSTLNLINEECERNNLLPPGLQWTQFFERELGIRPEVSTRYMASTESSRAREAIIAEERRVREESRISADRMRSRLERTEFVAYRPYMASTELSRTREAVITEERRVREEYRRNGRGR